MNITTPQIGDLTIQRIISTDLKKVEFDYGICALRTKRMTMKS